MEGVQQILTPHEIEIYLESLEIFVLPDIGNARWFQQSERLRNLSLQAIFDVQSEKEEIVKEYLVTLQKLYHEVSIISLLEAVLFHEEVMESTCEYLIDLTDYCYRNIISFMSLETIADLSSDVTNQTEKERLGEQRKQIAFETGVKCISLLSYLAQHLKILPLSVQHRLLVIHDVPLLFTNLICEPPWVRSIDGDIEKYCEGKWKKVEPQNILELSKVEGQIWIALIQLLLSPDCQKKYDMSGYKKEQLLKLRSRLNEVTISQIPVLGELLRYLEHLSLFDAPVPKPGVVIEQMPEIWEYLQKEYRKQWKEIAKIQMKDYFSLSEIQLQNFCKKITGSFDLKNIEAMLSDHPICAQCKGKGLKRCSKCKNEWYCGRPCQVSHWPKHRSACDLMTE
ncbi:hypothetical protein JTE90_008850 [Oedothorax gibbosus]|uniref:MYND-type domain-containing protein n=1 Tax=Oedothorax gibbosus TaxID=931172 RepID=A0AAV6U006_9ARAC|nr:hypothetical protein JTE90_008850 [Oedothorax gibbosus]